MAQANSAHLAVPATGVTACLILIGNELLSGKVADTNGALAIKRLRDAGVEVVGVEVLQDDVPRIAGAVQRVRRELAPTLVLTSGGIGPTHDDVTMEAIAAAFDVPLERDEAFAARIREHFGDRTTEAALSMANLPRGTEHDFEDSFFPLLWIENVYILPGDPGFFAAKLRGLVRRVGRGDTFTTVQVFANSRESDIAAMLRVLQAADPSVAIGSYPRYDEVSKGWVTLVTLDGRDALAVDTQRRALLEQLPNDAVLRVESTNATPSPGPSPSPPTR